MKKMMKRVMAFALAAVMMLAMTATVFAADITITGGTEGTYAAYRLLDLTTSTTMDKEGKEVTNYAYTLNPDYTAVLQAVTKKTEQADILAYIEELKEAEVRVFADAVFEKVKSMTPDETTTGNVFTGVDQGYYLIAQKTASEDGAYSLVMLDTAGKDNIEIKSKADVPTVEKKVKETNDSTGTVSGWQDAADYDIGDSIPFQLTGTLPSSATAFDGYDTYKVIFHDTLSVGLDYDPNSVKVYLNGEGNDVTADFSVQYADHELTVTCSDVKSLGAAAGDKIIVQYTATMNEKAVTGSTGNLNKVYLEYSNNPYQSGEGDTGKTPEDKVIVFTYKIEADKVDADKKPLKGAGFTLYKYDSVKKDYVQIGQEIKGENVTEFEFKGADAGKYKLVETTVPNGYNKAEDIIFTVEAEYDTAADAPMLTTLVIKDEKGTVISTGTDAIFTATVETGLIVTEIVNNSGALLPSTGGIGTTIFYIVGILVMAGAVFFFAMSRRKKEH